MRRALALLASCAIIGAAHAQEAQAPAQPVAATTSDIATNSPVSAPSAAAPEATLPGPALPPAPSRARPLVTTDEGGLWGAADRAETEARASGQLESDPALNAYLHQVACAVAAGHCGDIRLYVMDRPVFNAQMAPNGYMEVWSGLLLRAENEAQLAFVLGHEVGHYGERHSLAMLRTVRDRANMAMVFSIIAGAAGVGLLGDIVYLGTLASVFGFSQEKESEADAIGFDRATAAGYDPNAGGALWRNLIAETQGSDNPDVRRSETRASVFRTHPLSADRVAALDARAAQAGGEGQTHRERYRAAIRPFLDAWLRADLRRRDYGQTQLVLDRLGKHGEDLGVVEYYRGEINRLRRADGDRERAIQHYGAATAQADAPAAAWRELGEYAARDQRNGEAAGFFTTYLQRAPNAPDRALVEARIAQLSGGGQ